MTFPKNLSTGGGSPTPLSPPHFAHSALERDLKRTRAERQKDREMLQRMIKNNPGLSPIETDDLERDLEILDEADKLDRKP